MLLEFCDEKVLCLASAHDIGKRRKELLHLEREETKLRLTSYWLEKMTDST